MHGPVASQASQPFSLADVSSHSRVTEWTSCQPHLYQRVNGYQTEPKYSVSVGLYFSF